MYTKFDDVYMPLKYKRVRETALNTYSIDMWDDVFVSRKKIVKLERRRRHEIQKKRHNTSVTTDRVTVQNT